MNITVFTLLVLDGLLNPMVVRDGTPIAMGSIAFGIDRLCTCRGDNPVASTKQHAVRLRASDHKLPERYVSKTSDHLYRTY
jgi:hypothetical protein